MPGDPVKGSGCEGAVRPDPAEGPLTEEEAMTTVFDISMSLDGYVTAAGVRPEEPMGDGGPQLHEWALGTDEQGHHVLAASASTVGAPIACPRIHDPSVPWRGPDGSGGAARTPTF